MEPLAELARSIVRHHHPDALAEYRGESWAVLSSPGAVMPLGRGATESDAWQRAAIRAQRSGFWSVHSDVD